MNNCELERNFFGIIFCGSRTGFVWGERSVGVVQVRLRL